jgi:hypothetical protein
MIQFQIWMRIANSTFGYCAFETAHIVKNFLLRVLTHPSEQLTFTKATHKLQKGKRTSKYSI